MAPSLPDSSPDSNRLWSVVLVCLMLSTALSVPILAAGGLGVSLADGHADDETTDNESIRIDDSLESADGTVEVVVRLEEPTIPDAIPADDADEYLAEHAEESQEPLLDYADRTAGISVETEFWVANAVLLTVDTERVDLETFARFSAVEAVHENFEVSIPEQPSSTSTAFGSTTGEEPTPTPADATATDPRPTAGLELLNAPAVWDEYETRGAGVRVAVLDTGIDATHPDLELYTDDPSDPTYPGGWAEFDADGNRIEGSTPYDSGTHGTHVSGTIAGGTASGTRIGVAPEAELLHGLVLRGTSGSFAQIVAGVEWALASEADVISMSLGANGRHDALIEPVRNARDSGAVVVAAVGNEGVETSNSPANVYDAVSVGAVDESGVVPAFSGGERINRSEWQTPLQSWPSSYTAPDVVAPGVRVTSTVPGGYQSLPGTSMATPHVSGAVALLHSIDPTATPDDIEDALYGTAWIPETAQTQSETEIRYGHGIVDAEAAANALVSSDRRPVGTTAGESAETHTDGTPSSLVALLGGVVIVIVTVCLWALRSGFSTPRDDP
ncbi:peptidase S8/S53 subtilisin kexin sedolisin [Haloterrigena salina JCM 13891]|uniref:Peptidase S8/S53 subtilisin kexin sedolisin n=1 Tax=Haloterrigena salina JCM 13891 TaxID=1227488 RepID=M0C2D7_9EURY|nr:S8 family serine peptidase [Haloterrigena salina]ELZ17375.1 peptidase S8/S53 subtilisin kexin sedolisin [Haloterrigena salina JCM 13891]